MRNYSCVKKKGRFNVMRMDEVVVDMLIKKLYRTPSLYFVISIIMVDIFR